MDAPCLDDLLDPRPSFELAGENVVSLGQALFVVGTAVRRLKSSDV